MPILLKKTLDADFPLLSMRFARQQLGKNFMSTVSEALYSSKVIESDTLRAIVGMSKVRMICCFNFDDVSSMRLRKGKDNSSQSPKERRFPSCPVTQLFSIRMATFPDEVGLTLVVAGT